MSDCKAIRLRTLLILVAQFHSLILDAMLAELNSFETPNSPSKILIQIATVVQSTRWRKTS
jgi:hypothetical protein